MEKVVENMNWYVLRVMGGKERKTVELINKVAMTEGLRFAIREGGRTVGAGQITSIIE